jgi:hypothetical protein
MFTYEQYKNNDCTFDDFYGQFVTKNIIDWVDNAIGSRIRSSTDPSFNDIDLRFWDSLSPIVIIGPKSKELGLWDCLASRVCILKQAARIIKEENVSN